MSAGLSTKFIPLQKRQYNMSTSNEKHNSNDDDINAASSKRQRPSLSFVLDSRCDFHPSVLPAPEAFENAFEMATTILLSNQYRMIFFDLVPEADASIFTNEMENTYEIKCIDGIYDNDAFACVHREMYERTVFFNPVLLMKFNKVLLTTDEASRRIQLKSQSWFLAIKLIHEMTHLLNYQSYLKVKGVKVTPKKKLKEVLIEGEKETTYSDLGTLMEKSLFGYIAEPKSLLAADSFMRMDSIAMYVSTETLHGNLLDPILSSYDPVKIVVGQQFISTFKPSVTNLKVTKGGYRASAARLDEDDGDDNDCHASNFLDSRGVRY
jgi:hypothetical protein